MALHWCAEAWANPDRVESAMNHMKTEAESAFHAAGQIMLGHAAEAAAALTTADNLTTELEALERGQRQPPAEETALERRRGEIAEQVGQMRGFDARISDLGRQLAAARQPLSPSWMQADYLTAQLDNARGDRQAYLSSNPGAQALPGELQQVESAIQASKDARLGAAASNMGMTTDCSISISGLCGSAR